MKVYSPFQLTPEESQASQQELAEQAERMNVTDETLSDFIRVFFDYYRSTLEHYFSNITSHVPLYAEYPFKTMILRLGPNGIIIGHQPSTQAEIKVTRPNDYDPPLESLNLFTVVKRWQTPYGNFDFRPRGYNVEEARDEGIARALADALSYFWQVVDTAGFCELCLDLLKAENIALGTEEKSNEIGRFDAIGTVILQEPAGFRRFEKWAFEFKHYRDQRISAQFLRDLETYLKASDSQIHVVCLVTSGDLTSIGKYIAVENPQVRVWDRTILQNLINQHLSVLGLYFTEYTSAVEALTRRTELIEEATSSRFQEFHTKLNNCPTGQKHFSIYEKLGIEIWCYLFSTELGEAKPQQRTIDGVQRRDVLFRNNRGRKFFQRIASKFDADFVIVDFKNYTDPIKPDVIDEVAKYANKALGRFIVVVSRQGADDSVTETQIRYFRDRDLAILVVSDAQLLEMITRKESSENPEDVIEDLLDEFLIRF